MSLESMCNEERFSLLLKTKVNVYILKSFIGHILIYNVTKNQSLKVPFTFYETFYQHLLQMIDFFIDNENFQQTRKIIFVQENLTISWTSCIENNEKIATITQTDEISTNFEVSYNFEFFFTFLKGFTSCILPTLNLNQDQKLLFQTIFCDDFQWPNEDLTNLNEKQIIFHFLKIKTDLKLDIDISDIFQIFKFYLPILLLLKKASGLMLLNLDNL